MLLNYTNRPLLFVHKDNLVNLGNGRFQIDDEKNLERREYLPIAGSPLRVKIVPQMVMLTHNVPVVQEVLVDADDLPPGDDLLIVSKQYAEACRRLCRPTDRLRVVCGGVYTPSLPYPVACTGIAMVEGCLPYVMPKLFDITNGPVCADEAMEYIRSQRNGLMLQPMHQLSEEELAQRMPIRNDEYEGSSDFSY